MKKTIGKPENWQDFESLCKKLFGEIWKIPEKIKKNGRLGQEQAGVDIYGIPKDQDNYWGIQCKGKDDYSQAKLKESEILIEIEKAKTFQPPLKVFIIASTTNKDAKLEQFVRLEDVKNRNVGSFEVLLFCWEDLVDLIENNTETYYWYLNGINQKGKYDFSILFNDMAEELTIKPVFQKEITKYKLVNKSSADLLTEALKKMETSRPIKLLDLNPFSLSKSSKINNSWCDFELIMANTGTVVLDDWRVIFRFAEGVARIDNGHFMFPRLSPTTYINNENLTITYRPIENEPLIQKDNRYFETSILPKPNCKKIVLEWELLARDFNIKSSIQIGVEPSFVEIIKYEEVNDQDDLIDDKVFISYHMTENI